MLEKNSTTLYLRFPVKILLSVNPRFLTISKYDSTFHFRKRFGAQIE